MIPAKQALVEALFQQGQPLASEQDEWLERLTELMRRVESWLSDLIENGQLSITRGKLELREADLGIYDAPTLVIKTRTREPREIRLEPRGRSVVGVVLPDGGHVAGLGGRIDLVCGARRAMLLLRLADDVWLIVSRSYPQPAVLSEETLMVVLRDLVI